MRELDRRASVIAIGIGIVGKIPVGLLPMMGSVAVWPATPIENVGGKLACVPTAGKIAPFG